MKRLVLLFALGLAACDRDRSEDQAAPTAPDASLSQQAPARSAQVVPKPKEQAQLDRMILAGYTPHGDHLHPPGVNHCPLTKGTEAVM